MWPNPKRRSVGLFTDLRLFFDALEVASNKNDFTKSQLEAGLSKRVKGLVFIEKLSTRIIDDLIRELQDFEWIQQINNRHPFLLALSEEGKNATEFFQKDPNLFRNQLISKMQKVYTIPGWFVNRLWDINPDGQGEIVIPAPPRQWYPKSREWEDKEWTEELAEQASDSIRLINKVCKGAFPIDEKLWLEEVHNAWNRLSNTTPRRTVARIPAQQKEKGKMKTYAPRRRLANSMKEAAVKLLFGNKNPITDQIEFKGDKPPLSPRTYMAWCPRLAELGLIFYTDFHLQIPGRLIFPTSVFNKKSNGRDLQLLPDILNPKEEHLYLHQPQWNDIKDDFIEILFNEHQKNYSIVKSLYVSILNVRDEVCRQLRLSADYFDKFLSFTISDTLNSNGKYAISLETDIREDQVTAYQRLRRPVIVNNTPFSLIAMTKS